MTRSWAAVSPAHPPQLPLAVLLTKSFSVLRPATKAIDIEIVNSDQFSIGEGPTTLWVSGNAGWFEINPSKKYEAMYSQVQAGIKLYYGIMSAYEKHAEACTSSKKRRQRSPPQPTLDEVFLQVRNWVSPPLSQHAIVR